MQGICILCHNEKTLIESHVVSKFLRKLVFGPAEKSGSYNLAHGKTPPRLSSATDTSVTRFRQAQDLPKPRLMCSQCDGSFSGLEDRLSKIIRAAGLREDPRNIYLESCLATEIPLDLKRYRQYKLDAVSENIVARVGVLTCWRALHDNSSNSALLYDYLASPTGLKMQADTLSFVAGNQPSTFGRLWVLLPTPELAREMGGAGDIATYGWDVHLFPSKDAQYPNFVVSLWFAHWLLIWSPQPYSSDPVVSELVGDLRARGIAESWPLEILRPRVQAAAAKLNTKPIS